MSKSSRRRARAKVRKQTPRRGVAVKAVATPVATKTQPRSRPLSKAERVEPARPGPADAVHAVVWRTGLLSLILIPVLTMRLIAEERIQGTLELLLTSPVRDWELAVGKWLGAFAFYLLLLATTLVYVVLLAIYVPDKTIIAVAGISIRVGALDFGQLASTYIGMLLVGAASVAIGVLASALTRNQIIAYVVTLFGLLAIWYTAFLIGFFTTPPLSLFFDYVAGYYRYQPFSLGQVTLLDTVYFASLAVGALCLTTTLLESRRWR